MVIRTILGLTITLPLAIAQAAVPITRMSAVTIQQNGARSNDVSGDETAAQCSRFRLTPAQVTRFFAQAQPVDSQAYHHDLDMSRCHAAGTARDSGGKTIRWTIDLMRRGAILSPGQPARYVYCVTCASPPFDEMDAETADAARALIAAAKAR